MMSCLSWLSLGVLLPEASKMLTARQTSSETSGITVEKVGATCSCRAIASGALGVFDSEARLAVSQRSQPSKNSASEVRLSL